MGTCIPERHLAFREEIQKTINECLKQGDFEEVYDVIFDGSEDWQNLEVNLDQNF